MGEIIVGLASLIVGAAVAIEVYRRQRNIKQLDYEVISTASLLQAHAAAFERELELRYRSTSISNPNLVLLRILNTGNRPIETGDYQGPIEVNFGSEAQVLSAQLARARPEDIKVSTRTDGRVVMIEPTLLNPEDWIAIKVLLSDKPGTLAVKGRLSGVKQIRPYREQPGRLALSTLLFTIVSTAGLTAILTELVDRWLEYEFIPSMEALTANILFAALVALSILLAWFFRRNEQSKARRKAAMKISFDLGP